MKIVITEKQLRILTSEQSDAMMDRRAAAVGQLIKADPHTTLMIFQIATMFIPVVGPFVSAGIGLADAAIYAKEGDNKSAGMAAMFALLPGIGSVVSKIPGVKQLGKNGMTALANKLIKNGDKAKLTKLEKETLDLMAKEKNLITQELNNTSKQIASKTAQTTKNPATKSTMKKIATSGLKFVGTIGGYAGAGVAYDKIYDKVNPSPTLEKLAEIKPSEANVAGAASINWD